MSTMIQNALVVGGGFSGMSAAIELRKLKIDVDAVKSIPDAIQASGVVANDKQFVELSVRRIADAPTSGVFFEIRKL